MSIDQGRDALQRHVTALADQVDDDVPGFHHFTLAALPGKDVVGSEPFGPITKGITSKPIGQVACVFSRIHWPAISALLNVGLPTQSCSQA